MKKIIEKINLLKNKKYYLLLLILCGLIAGGFMIWKDNRHILSLPKEQQGNMEYGLSQIEADGFSNTADGLLLNQDVEMEQSDGTEMESLRLEIVDTLNQNQGLSGISYPYLHIKNDGSYIHKLQYQYASDGRVEAVIVAYDENSQGICVKGSFIDQNNQFLDTSVQMMATDCSDVLIVFTQAKNLTIHSVSRLNTFRINYIRFFFAFAAVYSFLFVIFVSRQNVLKLERVFVVLAFLIGGSFILAIPTQKVGWDECYHFAQAYQFVTHKNVGDVVQTYMDDSKVWPLNPPQTVEEYEALDQCVDKLAVGTTNLKAKYSLTNLVGYFFPGLGIAIGTLFGLSFSELFLFGKLFSLLFYIAVVYLAIRRMKTGKCLMTMVALMPTCMYICSIYNRDSVMLAFSFLATAYLFSLFFDKDRCITWKDYGILMLSLFAVCYLKAVYAPMLLLIFLLPKDTFPDKKTRRMMLAGVVLVCVLLVFAILVPGMLESGGDSRGLELAASTDAVISHSQQLSYILHHVGTYAKLLLRMIFGTFVDYTVGSSVWEALGHYATIPSYGLLTVVLIFTIITDTNEQQNEINMVRRVGIFVLLAASVAMVWTSMYMAYTVVGANEINGVQARYYLPVLLPFFLLFNTKKIQFNGNWEWYRKFIIGFMVLVNYVILYMSILKPYCM